MSTALTAHGSNGSVIKGFNECENMVVRTSELQAIVLHERNKIDDVYDGKGETEVHGFTRSMGFESVDSYYKFMYKTKSEWISIDLADRILVGLGLHYLYNTGQITIYKIKEGLAYPLAH